MKKTPLFTEEDLGPAGAAVRDAAEAEQLAAARPRVRFVEPQREQVEFRAMALDGLLRPDHPARALWAYVQQCDMRELEADYKAVEGVAGRPVISFDILATLWLQATADDVGSAREIERLCERDAIYMWICGGVHVGHRVLSEFRTKRRTLLNEWLVMSMAALSEAGFVKLEEVAQDGAKTRAAAGASSFRRVSTLRELLPSARERVERLERELEPDPSGAARRKLERDKRHAEDRARRIERALAAAEAEQLRIEPDKDGKVAEARASTTDATAHVMKMGDGGYRPAYNVQFATDTANQVIVGVSVATERTDHGQMEPMLERVQGNTGRTPGKWLADGGYASKEDIEAMTAAGSTPFVPLTRRKGARDPHEPRKDDSPAVAAWRARMATDEAKAIYKRRASTAECVNALARRRTLSQFLVRGLDKVWCVALWVALTHNVLRLIALGALGAAA